ncbi:MAG: Bax inhibitor-1/YccA family protein [Lachnospiraceae bacterium]|nr:Bax inhibitor-1/YccA family protein [Lachnospiraceae bacterium]
MNRTEYDQNNVHYTEYTGGNQNYYSGNNAYGNENYWSNGNYYDNTYDREEIEQKVITRSFIVMFISLLVTALTATIVAANIDMFVGVMNSFSVLLVLEIIVVIAASFAVNKRNAVVAGVLYSAYSIINGLTLSVIFFAYELGSIQEIFMVTAILFAVMAVIGATTKKNLSSLGGICTMLLSGALLVTVINALILHSSGIELVLDYVIVAIFVGLTAYDTQKMKSLAATASTADVNTIAIYCGMELYLDFINLFLRLLSIFGKSRD